MQPRDPIDELHDTQLYIALSAIDAEYAERITTFVAAIAPILATTQQHFPYYTRHDAHHGFRVVRRIEQVIKPACLEAGTPEALAPAEIFLLIGAAYAHDLGMTIFPGETERLLGSMGLTQAPGWETDERLQRQLRQEHSKRGGEYIRENADALRVPTNLTGALDMMMRAHNMAIPELEEAREPYAAQERELDVRQLAAIVCIGDALEYSDTRVMEGVLDRIGRDFSAAARRSYLENMKHVCLGDSLAVNPDGRVIASGTFSEPEVLALAHQALDDIEGWVQGYCDIDRRSRHQRLKVRPEPMLRNLAYPSGRFERLGVRLNKRSVIDLIASNAVWRLNAGIAIRELVQNAVEACRYRAHRSGAADRYRPQVTVEFDREHRTVTVTDNGCGMSERTVLNNLLTVGSSRSKEAGYADEAYAPIARFGIGFWSVFTFASAARIETAEFEPYWGRPESATRARGVAFDVSLEELRDYTVFEPITRPAGTRIALTLNDLAALDDVFSQAKVALHCAPVPITLVLDGEETVLPVEVPDVSDADILGGRSRILDDLGVKIFRWRGELDDTEVSLGLAYRIVDGKATFLAERGASLQTKMGHIRSPKASICGFSVPIQPGPLCIDLLRVGNLRANHRSPRGFEFSLDRQQLLPNAASRRFIQNIVDLFHTGYRRFLAETNSGDAATIASLRDHAQMHGGNVFDSFTASELSDAAARYPDLLCLRLYPVEPGKPLSNIEPLHVDLTALKQLRGTVFTLQTRVDVPVQGGRYLSFDTEGPDVLAVTYAAVQAWMQRGEVAQPAYVIETNRLGSMLFDADPDGSLKYVAFQPFGNICIQSMRLERMRFAEEPKGVIIGIQGRWTGTVYIRSFSTPTGKPYQFLGRYRVLVHRSSRLAQHLLELQDAGRMLHISELLHLLTEDEKGFTSEDLSALLSPAPDPVNCIQ